MEDKELEEMMVKEMGKAFGMEIKKAFDDLSKRYEEQKRLQDQRYENTVERLTRIETKIDSLGVK